MSSSITARLRRLIPHFRSPTCSGDGPACERVHLAGDGTLDPVVPPLPQVCDGCGRPVAWTVVRVLAVDVSRI